MEAGMVGVVGTGGAIAPKSKSILGTGSTTGSSLNITSPMSEVAQISDASVDVPQTMLSPAAAVPQTTLSQSAPPQSVPHTMLSPAEVPHTMLSPLAIVPHTMLSPAEVPHTTLSKFAVPHAVPQTMLSPAAPR